MKKFLLFLLFSSSFIRAQMPDISEIWINNSKPYLGTIGNSNEQIKFKVNISERNQKEDQEYFLSGYSLVEKIFSKFEGKVKITQYKDGKKRSFIYGVYEFAEKPTGKHSGLFKGKFVYTFLWNKKTEKIEKQNIAFTGDWKSYDSTLTYKTNWTNKNQ